MGRTRFRYLFVVGALVASHASAYSVTPLRQTIGVAGNEAIGQLDIDNPGSGTATLSLFVERAEVADDGSVRREPAEDDFILFPPQTIIPPGASQKVQLRYVGAPDLDAGVLYVVTVEQLPIDLEGDSTNLAVGINFVTVVNVQPTGAASEVVLADAALDGSTVTLRVANDGRASDRLSRFGLRLDGVEDPVPLEDAWLGDSSIIPALATRTISVPRDRLPTTIDVDALSLEAVSAN